MPKLTKEERAELEAKLREDDAEDDEDDESEVGFSDGSYFRGKHRRVKEVAAARGMKLKADPEPEPEEDPKKLKVAPEPRRFGGRRVS